MIATARCVLPTPGGPRSITTSALAMNRPVAISRISFLSSEGWAAKSSSYRVDHEFTLRLERIPDLLTAIVNEQEEARSHVLIQEGLTH